MLQHGKESDTMTSAGADDLYQFFTGYAAAALGDKPELLAALYAQSFLAAGPEGSAAFKNDDAFLQWLSQVHDFNRATGMTGMEVASVDEYRLSDLFTVATVSWGATFRKTGNEVILFKISYIVQRTDGSYRVLGYVSHEDQMSVMRAKGLL